MPKKFLFLLLSLSLFCLTATTVLAQSESLVLDPTNNTGCPSGYSGNCGNYSLDDFTLIAINASRIVLGLIGSLALLMFIYGGVLFLISAGSSESVGKAKKVIVAAVIGLVIVFASFLIIKFVLGTMGITWNGGKLITSSTAPAHD